MSPIGDGPSELWKELRQIKDYAVWYKVSFYASSSISRVLWTYSGLWLYAVHEWSVNEHLCSCTLYSVHTYMVSQQIYVSLHAVQCTVYIYMFSQETYV